MPTDLAELLNQAAPEPTRSLDPERLWRAGQHRRRHRRVTVTVAILVVAGLSVAGVNWLDTKPDRVVTAAETIVADDPTHGFSVDYPATWRRATMNLTPGLTDPVEILSLGTGDLVPGGHSCAQFPVAALEAMSPTDAFMTVQERRSPQAAGLAPGESFDETTGFPDRPSLFPPTGSENASEVIDCLARPPVFDHWWFSYSEAGRGFHVLVAIGTQATQRTRAETWAILDSLQLVRITSTTVQPGSPSNGAVISGLLLDGRVWTVHNDPAHGLCVTLGDEPLGCDDEGPVIASDADPATPRIALAADASSFNSGSLVYGFLPDGATSVELVHDAGGSITAGLVIEPDGRFWAVPVDPDDNPETVIYRDDTGAEVERFTI